MRWLSEPEVDVKPRATISRAWWKDADRRSLDGASGAVIVSRNKLLIKMKLQRILFSFAEYLAACCEGEDEENPP